MDSCVEDRPEEARLGGGTCHMGKYKESKTVTEGQETDQR